MASLLVRFLQYLAADTIDIVLSNLFSRGLNDRISAVIEILSQQMVMIQGIRFKRPVTYGRLLADFLSGPLSKGNLRH